MTTADVGDDRSMGERPPAGLQRSGAAEDDVVFNVDRHCDAHYNLWTI